jgi:hypothetical protein
MNSIAKALIVIGSAICFFGILFVLSFRTLSPENEETTYETPVTPENSNSMRADGLPITVSRIAFTSSYGGWHGDGTAVTAYRYGPSDSEALVAALARRHPEFSWQETQAEFVTCGSPWTLLPRDLRPESKSSVLLMGRAEKGDHTLEYAVDRARGTLYSVSNRF